MLFPVLKIFDISFLGILSTSWRMNLENPWVHNNIGQNW